MTDPVSELASELISSGRYPLPEGLAWVPRRADGLPDLAYMSESESAAMGRVMLGAYDRAERMVRAAGAELAADIRRRDRGEAVRADMAEALAAEGRREELRAEWEAEDSRRREALEASLAAADNTYREALASAGAPLRPSDYDSSTTRLDRAAAQLAAEELREAAASNSGG